MITRGSIIEGPDGQGYELLVDIHPAQPCLITDVKPLGGAPIPRAGEDVPKWLMKAVSDLLREAEDAD